MKILVTGAAGYIGSHTIIEILTKTDWEVIGIDNYSNSTPETFDRIKEVTGKTIKNYPIDLKDISATEAVFAENPNIAGVIHFAAYKAVGESVEDPLKYYDNNLNTLANVLKCQEKYNVSSLIFSSSCAVYGNVDVLPVTEESPQEKAESPYAYTKQIGEVMVEDFIKISKTLKAISLRYFNPVGAHVSGLNGELSNTKPNNLVPFITQTAIGKQESLTVFGSDYDTVDGTCVRDYIHVTDIANAHVLALQYLIEDEKSKQYEVINLGTGIGVSVLEVITAFEKVSGKKLNYTIGGRRSGDVISIYANNNKAKELIQWAPELGLEEMMLSAWKWENKLFEK
jgi:UDP-glucose 4-epimerase